MAKIFAIVGYVHTVERVENGIPTGIWEEQVTERSYYGDKTRDIRRLQTPDTLNDNIVLSDEISIVSDPYAQLNYYAIRYVRLGGVAWKVTSADVQYPRIKLTLGEVYNV